MLRRTTSGGDRSRARSIVGFRDAQGGGNFTDLDRRLQID
jgi:hypothetical protein